MRRRSFIASALALIYTPIILRAESLIELPIPEPDLPSWLIGYDLGSGDFTIEAWYFDNVLTDIHVSNITRDIKPPTPVEIPSDGNWHKLAITRGNFYIDGIETNGPANSAQRAATKNVLGMVQTYLK